MPAPEATSFRMSATESATMTPSKAMASTSKLALRPSCVTNQLGSGHCLASRPGAPKPSAE